MAYLGSWQIDDFITFYCNTHVAATGAGADADAVPTWRIYEDETGAAIANGNMALLDAANTVGFYSERVQLLAATGFEKGRQYSVYIAVTVATVPATMHHTFQIEAEVDANSISVAATNQIRDAIFVNVIEGALTFEQYQRIMFAVLRGLSGGGGTPVLNFRNLANTADRVRTQVDQSGNRLAVIVLDGT